jgi:hypothetical protein
MYSLMNGWSSVESVGTETSQPVQADSDNEGPYPVVQEQQNALGKRSLFLMMSVTCWWVDIGSVAVTVVVDFHVEAA